MINLQNTSLWFLYTKNSILLRIMNRYDVPLIEIFAETKFEANCLYHLVLYSKKNLRLHLLLIKLSCSHDLFYASRWD